jgi:SulP family sulfate permease
MKLLDKSHLRGDLAGGINAAVVAMPLALAFGALSGAGPMAGFYGAIFLGLFAALFGGTAAQISGPTGPTALVMVAVFTHYAYDPAQAFTVVMISGVCQILFGVLRLGRYINLMPYPVVSGWMSGIGAVIIIMSLGPAIGHDSSMTPQTALFDLPRELRAINPSAMAVALLTLGIAALPLGRYAPLVPRPLIALIAGTLLALVLAPMPLLGEQPPLLPTIVWPHWTLADLGDMLFAGLMIALLGSIDSLLASLAADAKTNTWHNSDRELVGQGIGNLFAGLFGGIPGAGTQVRTLTNIRNGGRTRLSGVIHSGAMVLMVLALYVTLPLVPLAALAGVLIRIALSIIDWRYLRRVRTAPRSGVLLMFAVLVMTISINLLLAVAVGTVLASLIFVKRMADLQLEGIRTLDRPGGGSSLSEPEAELMQQLAGRVLLVQLSGPMSFGAATGLHRRMRGYQDYDVLVLDLSDVPSIDSSATLALEEIIMTSCEAGHTVELVGIRMPVARVFARLGVLDLIRDCDRHPTRLDALRAAAENLGVATLPATDDGEPGRGAVTATSEGR